METLDTAKYMVANWRKVRDAERKVIEAAKAQLAVKDEAIPVWITATTKTERAVEDLLATEGETP